MKKFILLALTALMVIGCGMAIDGLDVVNGTEYVVKAKRINRNNDGYVYNLVKAGDTWYDYAYKDTADFNVGDTLILTIKKISNNYGTLTISYPWHNNRPCIHLRNTVS